MFLSMLPPITGWNFILPYSLSVSAEGLLRIYSGIAIFPMSCKEGACPKRHQLRFLPRSRIYWASSMANACTRRMCPCVYRSFASTAAAKFQRFGEELI